MAKKKEISRVKLNNLHKSLPAPVKEHLRRCKKFADYYVQRVKTEDWFKEAKYKVDNLVASIFYHDVGKYSIQKDYLHLEGCTKKSDQAKYYQRAFLS